MRRLTMVLGAVMIAAGGAGAQERTACDSPCKLMNLPLVVPQGRVTMLTDPRVDMLMEMYKPFMSYQVDSVAKLLSSSRPTYPDDLDQRVNGTVIGLIIVDSLGRAIPGSMQLLYSTDSHFSAAARDWLTSMRYAPARLGARRVAQIVRQSFDFVVPR